MIKTEIENRAREIVADLLPQMNTTWVGQHDLFILTGYIRVAAFKESDHAVTIRDYRIQYVETHPNGS